MSAAYFAGVRFHSASHKQSMMSRVQAGCMWYRSSADRPFRSYGAFFEIDDLHVTVASYNVSHRNVQSFSGLDSDTGRITARQLDASHQFACLRIDYFDRGVRRSVIAATLEVIEDFNSRIEEMRCRIVCPVIRSAIRVTISGQFDGL